MVKFYGNNAVTKLLQLLKPQLDAKEVTANKVTSVSSDSTDTQYPSAKAVYTLLDGAVKCEVIDTQLIFYAGVTVSGTNLIVG